MTNGPHTLGVGYGSLLGQKALRVWIGSRLNPYGKCRFRGSPAVTARELLEAQNEELASRLASTGLPALSILSRVAT